MTKSAVLEQSTTEEVGLPNKFIYPEFAGFAGEKHLKAILRQILPMALYRTWEIFVENQAYGNDCFLSVERLAEQAQRAPKTIRQNLLELMAKRLLHMHGERKIFRGPKNVTYTRPVVVKDFTGLYTLAHEYDLWCQSGDYIEPRREFAELLTEDPSLEAKVRRFDNYRRILYTQRSGPEMELAQEERWFRDYDAEKAADRAEVENTRPFCPKQLPKEPPKQLPKGFQNESNERAYKNSQRGDSFDSEEPFERGGSDPALQTDRQKRAGRAGDYTKEVRDTKTGMTPSDESRTNPVPFSQKAIPPAPGKTRESAENHPDVQLARSAMAATGVTPGRSARHQAEEELAAPPKHPLARSFVHEVAGLFGDLNEKGSKTGIERSIETFELELPAEVLLCLVRAYVVARDTKAEKIRHRHPQTGAANRMPLFCSMFKTFARALASGSTWEYAWEQMLEDIEADDRLSLWLSEHQAQLVGEECAQAAPAEADGESPVEERCEETCEEEAGSESQMEREGWADGADAYEQAERLIQAIVAANYSDIEVGLRPNKDHRYSVIYRVLVGEGGELVLSNEAQIDYLIEQAELGQL